MPAFAPAAPSLFPSAEKSQSRAKNLRSGFSTLRLADEEKRSETRRTLEKKAGASALWVSRQKLDWSCYGPLERCKRPLSRLPSANHIRSVLLPRTTASIFRFFRNMLPRWSCSYLGIFLIRSPAGGELTSGSQQDVPLLARLCRGGQTRASLCISTRWTFRSKPGPSLQQEQGLDRPLFTRRCLWAELATRSRLRWFG